MQHLPRILGLPVLLVLCSTAANAQIIAGDGDDLQALIDSAPSGSIIEIHSDSTFPGPLTFAATPAKDLSLIAGDGYAPVIDGGSDKAIIVETSGKSTRLKGLTLSSVPSYWSIAMVSPPLAAGEVQELVVDDCDLSSGLYVVHTGDGRVEVTVRDCTVTSSGMNLSAFTGEFDVLVRDTTVEDLRLYDSSAADVDVTVEDSTILDLINLYAGNGTLDLELLRCRVEGPTDIRKNTGAVLPHAFLRAEGSLFIGTTASVTAAGIEVEPLPGPGSLDLELVNCTVTDYGTGIELPTFVFDQGSVVLRNTLLANNDEDLTGSLGQATIQTCMAEDLFLGLGSILDTAQLDADLALVPGTPGTDAGTSTGLNLAPTDLYGHPRLVDVDCDGVVEVSIGAVEAPPSLLAAKTTVAFDNPAGTTTSLPRVGDTLNVQVDLGPHGLVALAAVGTPLPLPFPVPGWNGDLLIDPVTATTYPSPSGLLAFSIPLDLSLVGFAVSIQGARLEQIGGARQVQLLDRVDLSVGY